MMPRIAWNSALTGLVAGLVVFMVLGAGYASRPVDTYELSVISVGKDVVYTRMNTSTGKVETWRYLVTQVPSYRDSKILNEPRY